MRVAHLAPSYEAVPLVAFGATKRLVSYLTQELVRHGHEVTVITCRRGAAPDILEDRVSGVILDRFPEAVEAARRVG